MTLLLPLQLLMLEPLLAGATKLAVDAVVVADGGKSCVVTCFGLGCMYSKQSKEQSSLILAGTSLLSSLALVDTHMAYNVLSK
jgi:hypothetical protein